MEQQRAARLEVVYTVIAFAGTLLLVGLVVVSVQRGGGMRWLATALVAVGTMWAWQRWRVVRRMKRASEPARDG